VARMMAPSIGRFMTRDPLPAKSYKPASNTYEFAMNSPANYGDPSGLQPEGQASGLGLACGLAYEHLSDLKMLIHDWAPPFAHCWSHCKIAQNCPDAEDVSKAIGNYTETYQATLCQVLTGYITQKWACCFGVCKSAEQESDYEDNKTGFDLGSQNDGGDCEALCRDAVGGQKKGEEKMIEGPGKKREYGPYCKGITDFSHCNCKAALQELLPGF